SIAFRKVSASSETSRNSSIGLALRSAALTESHAFSHCPVLSASRYALLTEAGVSPSVFSHALSSAMIANAVFTWLVKQAPPCEILQLEQASVGPSAARDARHVRCQA